MVVQGIQNVRRKQLHISYRREYQADAVINMKAGDATDCKIEFSLELTPLGTHTVRVRFLEDLDYPLVPIMNELKTRISEMDKNGILPR